MSKHLRFDAQVLKMLFSSVSSQYVLQKAHQFLRIILELL